MNTHKIKISICALALLLIPGKLLAAQAIPVQHMDFEYAADFSNDQVLMGASQNVFIGKVIQVSGSKDRGFGPETQFQVQIVSNIKGALTGTVTVDQQGGYENGVLYVVGDDTNTATTTDSYFLKPGSTYLLATRYSSQENWYTLNPYPTASKLISSNASLGTAALKLLALRDSRVQQLVAAYPKEILLHADVVHNNALNSYISTLAAQKTATSS